MRIKILFFVFFLLLQPLTVGAEDLIKKGETLDLQRCISIALERHPSIQSSSGTLAAGESRVGQARSGFYPQLQRIRRLQPNRSNPASAISVSSISSAGQAYNSYSSSLSLSQNLYDFGKTSTLVKVQEFNRDAFRSDLDNVLIQITFGVKQAYYGLLQART